VAKSLRNAGHLVSALVATSFHLGDVVNNPGFRVRSYNQTLYLLTLLVEAVLILVPQPVPFLGVELGP
jgi:archaellum component FlaG (FlaF/FlaG flagellin family)